MRERLRIVNPEETAKTFIGLLLGDAQVRGLLDIKNPPDRAEVEARAERVAPRFMRLFSR